MDQNRAKCSLSCLGSGLGVVKNEGLEVRSTQVHDLPWPFASCVTWGKSLRPVTYPGGEVRLVAGRMKLDKGPGRS